MLVGTTVAPQRLLPLHHVQGGPTSRQQPRARVSCPAAVTLGTSPAPLNLPLVAHCFALQPHPATTSPVPLGVHCPAAVVSGGICPADAGLQLPASPWSASVVAAAHLLSGTGDAAKWAR
jgi:hypothetical protein